MFYIKNASTIKVGIEDWKPFVFFEDKKIKGVLGEILIKAFEVSGLKYTVEVKPWNSLIKSFKNKELDLIPSSYYSNNREKFALFSESYLPINEFIYIKQNASRITGFKDLANKKLAIVKGYSSIKELKKLYKNIIIAETANLEDSIIRLLKNEVDALFDSQMAVEYKLKELGILDFLAISQNDIKEHTLHYIFKKEDVLLRNIIQKSLYSIPIYEKNTIILNGLEQKNLKKR